MAKDLFRASVTYEPFHSEIREFPIPEVADDAGLLRIEAAGVCGSDIAAHADIAPERILGHENVGVIEVLGSQAAERWGVVVNDRVVVEEYLPCGHCDFCQTTDFRFCSESDPTVGGVRYGSTGIGVKPGFWGGFAEFLYLHPRSKLHKAPGDVDPDLLTLALPLGNGFEWAVVEGGSGPGQTVVVFGPGQQGLACVYAAKKAGAERVVLFGVGKDAHRLKVGKLLGADVAVNIEATDPLSLIKDLTHGRLADLVIDTARGDTATLSSAVSMLRQRGKYLFATASNDLSGVPLGDAQWKTLSLRGIRGHSYAAVEWAIGQISKDPDVLVNLVSKSFGLEDVDLAIRATANEAGQDSVHVSVLPWS